MPLKKAELYSSLWASCDGLRGGVDASQYKDYVLVFLFVKYDSDKLGQGKETVDRLSNPRPFLESSISCARRLARASSFFALATQPLAIRRYPGGCRRKKAHAVVSAPNRRSSAIVSLPAAFSNE